MEKYTEAQYKQTLQKASARIESLLREVKTLKSQPLIAITGAGCRLPGGAHSPQAFWHLLKHGADGIIPVPPQRWDVEQFYDPDPAVPGKMVTCRGGFLQTPIDMFDAPFFQITPKEAVSLDPQQRLLLEVVWEALENAGMDASRLKGSRTGVFIGMDPNEYGKMVLDRIETIDAYSATGNALGTASGRLSYLLGLEGPSMTIDTACSSSFVALHLACQSLRRRESSLALVGGVNLMLSPEYFICTSKLQALSPDGRCKTFDAAADGYGRGEGCVVVVLKRLADALQDRDPVLAVIKGSAINQDGKSNGLTAPNGRAQQQVIREALSDAGHTLADIDYLEAHGTGTSLGDSIELDSIGQLLRSTPREQPLRIGAVKTNIGHTEPVAGLASLLKVVLALQQGQMPPSLHFKTPNPFIPWQDLNLEVVTRLTEWPSGPGLRRAGISSFGYSGTNVHVIVEEAGDRKSEVGNQTSDLKSEISNLKSQMPDQVQAGVQNSKPDADSAPQSILESQHLLILSAKTIAALQEMASAYSEMIRSVAATDLVHICFTAATGRPRFRQRLAVMGATAAELADKLATFAANQHLSDGVWYGNQTSEEDGLPESDLVPPSSEKTTAADESALLADLARRHVQGPAPDWQALYQGRSCHKIGLPNYPFQRKSYWVAPRPASSGSPSPIMSLSAATSMISDPATCSRVPSATNQEPMAMKQESIINEQRQELKRRLTDYLQEAAGLEAAAITSNLNYFELGLDSLMLARVQEMIQNQLGVEIGLEQFYDEADTLDKTVELILQRRPPKTAPVGNAALPRAESEIPRPEAETKVSEAALQMEANLQTRAAWPPAPSGFAYQGGPVRVSSPRPATAEASAPAHALERLMTEQLQSLTELSQNMSSIILRQLEVLQGTPRPPGAVSPAPEPLTSQPPTFETVHPPTPPPAPAPAAPPAPAKSGGLTVADGPPPGANIRSMKFEPDTLTPTQRAFIQAFMQRYVARTPKSRALMGAHRDILADWINTLCFRLSLKQIAYPLVIASDDGVWLEDVDGNRYLDIAMGYGVSFLGNRPPFVVQALREQLDKGYELGPQRELTLEATRLIAELTGVERVAFCNTGSEAVMEALRLARAATGRPKIALFAGAYHGIFDGVLAVRSEAGIHPNAPGTPPSLIADTLVLYYDTAEALAEIRQFGDQLAAVLVEPVQSRRPDLQPHDFLHQLRELTTELGIALIFDEVITGFRIHPGGAQAWFGVQADLVTYGKVVGGGMPIGIVAGKARFMDTVDGGTWNYEDGSMPDKEVTTFAGTFCKHPLSMAATRAALQHLKDQGPALQMAVNEKTCRLALRLNRFFEAENVALRVVHFASLFVFEPFGKYHQLREPLEMELFFMLLKEKGVYSWERHINFLSTQHSNEDLDRIYEAITAVIHELRQGGFTMEARSKPLSLADPPVQQYDVFPAQQRHHALSQQEGADRACITGRAWQVQGDLNIDRLEAAFREVVRRHDSLRTAFEHKGDSLQQQVWAAIPFRLAYTDLPPEEPEALDRFVAELGSPFDLSRPPLLRVGVARLALGQHLLAIRAHNTIFDGPSMELLMHEVATIYRGGSLPPLKQRYADVIAWHQDLMARPAMADHLAFWQNLFADGVPVLNLPTDYSRPARLSFEGDRVERVLASELLETLKMAARKTGVTLNVLLLGAWQVLLMRVSGQQDFCVGWPSPRYREQENFNRIIGRLTNTTVMRCRPRPETSFRELLLQVRDDLLKVQAHADVPFETLVQHLARNPICDALFVYENAPQRQPGFPNLELSPWTGNATGPVVTDLLLEAIEITDGLRLNLQYTTALFQRPTMERWMGYYQQILKQIQTNPQDSLREVELK